MEAKELTKHPTRRQRQPPTIPFLWEERPGTPKKDWKPGSQKDNPVSICPVKLIASIPFKWEEKPGTPHPCFSQPPEIQHQMGQLLALPPPPAYTEENVLIIGEEECGFETDESFCSANSILANRIIPTSVVSNAIPVQSPTKNGSSQPQTPSSSASESGGSTSSYATGTASLVGASFLECLFPLLSSDSSFLQKVGCSQISSSAAINKPHNEDFDGESKRCVAVRRPQTLGELIMMSRRISHRRKAVQMQRQNLSVEIMKKSAFGCCIFGVNNKIGGVHWNWKRHLQLKLM